MKKTWKIRIDKVTYGLVYPTFFGNMIYDFINIILKKEKQLYFSVPDSLIIAGLIILFVVIDYMHLNGDVNTIFNKPEYKSRYYFFCDILTPTFLFTAFVLLRANNYLEYGIIAFALIPAIILVYKFKNSTSKIYFIIYSIISLTTGALILNNENFRNPKWIEFFIFFSMLAYTFYMLWFYPKKSRQNDLNYLEKLKIKYP